MNQETYKNFSLELKGYATYAQKEKYQNERRIQRPTNSDSLYQLFDQAVDNLANCIGFMANNEETVYQPGQNHQKKNRKSNRPILQRIIALEEEVKQNILLLSIQGKSGIPETKDKEIIKTEDINQITILKEESKKKDKLIKELEKERKFTKTHTKPEKRNLEELTSNQGLKAYC
ncbi:11285_t:CDS:2 [Entrophospora sp. SA101]|nr:11285_t:CDS:2 [Entrophospora sp. SA101]